MLERGVARVSSQCASLCFFYIFVYDLGCFCWGFYLGLSVCGHVCVDHHVCLFVFVWNLSVSVYSGLCVCIRVRACVCVCVFLRLCFFEYSCVFLSFCMCVCGMLCALKCFS